MANQIDALLEQLNDPAGRLMLEVGRPPRVVVGETETDAGQVAMTQQDILALLRPVVPPEERGRLRRQAAVTREYASADGRVFTVDIRWDGPKLKVRVAQVAGVSGHQSPPTEEQRPAPV